MVGINFTLTEGRDPCLRFTQLRLRSRGRRNQEGEGTSFGEKGRLPKKTLIVESMRKRTGEVVNLLMEGNGRGTHNK